MDYEDSDLSFDIKDLLMLKSKTINEAHIQIDDDYNEDQDVNRGFKDFQNQLLI